MYFRVFIPILLFSLGGLAFGQVPDAAPAQQTPLPANQQPQQSNQPPAGPNADPRDNRTRPLTPEEERERLIRQFDPLDPGIPQPGAVPQAGAAQQAAPAAPAFSGLGAGGSDNGQPATGETPLPGSLASADRINAQKRGPTVSNENNPDSGSPDFAGPGVLSRAYTVNRPLIAQDEKWSENFGISEIFTSGVTNAVVTSNGTVGTSGTLTGTSFTAGLSGRKLYRRNQFGIHIATQYQLYYPSTSNYNGANLNVSLDYTHVISRHLSLNLSGTGTYLSQNYILQNPVINPDISVANINVASSPAIQLFDTSTKQLSTQASLTWQINARLSLNIGGGYFAIVRDNPALLGSDGTQAQADINYRWSKKTTVGTYYSYSFYQFQHGAGTSNINTLGLLYSYAFSKTLQARLRFGGSQVESLAYTPVTLDPSIAALLGQTQVIVNAYRKITTSDISAQIVKDFGLSRTSSLSYVKGVSPGNGFYQASQQEVYTLDFTQRFWRVYAVSLQVSRATLSSISQTLGNYTNDTVQLSLSRTFRREVAANFQISYRHFEITDSMAIHPQILVSTGLSWSPDRGRLWPF